MLIGRAELNEEHPYVEVMPQKGGAKKAVTKQRKMAKKAVEEERQAG